MNALHTLTDMASSGGHVHLGNTLSMLDDVVAITRNSSTDLLRSYIQMILR